MRRPALLLIASLMAGVCAPALAPPRAHAAAGASDKAARKKAKKLKKKAKRLEKKGKKAYAKGKYDDAIAAFELAHLAWPQPRYLFNIGRCWEKKGDLYTAMEFIQRYVDAVEDGEEREDAADIHAILRSKLLKSSGEVSLKSEPPGATVSLTSEDGDKKTGATPLSTWLPAGTWKMRMALQDHDPVEEDLVVAIGGTLDRSYTLDPEGTAAKAAAAAEAVEAAAKAAAKAKAKEEAAAELPGPDQRAEGAPVEVSEAEDPGGSSLGAWIALGAGGALLAGGAVFGVLTQQANDDLQAFKDDPGSATEAEAKDARDASDSHSLTANVLLGAGAVAAGVGVYLLLAGGDDAAATPWVGAEGVGLALGGRW